MALIELAVDGLELTVTGGGSSPVATITSTPSTKVLAETKGVYFKQLDVSLSNCESGSCQNASGKGSILPAATKVKAEGELVMRKGDKNTAITVYGTDTGGGACSFTVAVEITTPGQTKSKGA